MLKKGFSTILDASRWIAALFVVISHAHHIVLVNFQDVRQPTIIWKALYFFGSFGRESVVIFFVVSGLLVGGLTSQKWLEAKTQNKPIEIRKYFAQRTARIYTVLLPALVFGWLFDSIRLIYFNVPGFYSPQASNQIDWSNYSQLGNLSAQGLLGNIFMLETIATSVWGSNGPLWSLAYEWWYYCIFAAAMGLKLYSRKLRLLSLTCLTLFLLLLPAKLLLWMAIWLLGVAAYFYSRTNLPKPCPIFGLIVLTIALTISRFHHIPGGDDDQNGASMYNQFIKDFLLGASYSFSLIAFSRIEGAIYMSRIHARLAAFSYSIYLTHFPFLVLLVAASNRAVNMSFPRQPSILSYAYVLCLVVIIYLFGYVFSLFTEKHNGKVLGFLLKIFLRERAGLSPR